MNNTIVSVAVRRKRLAVSYVPRHVVGALPDNSNVVSIEYFEQDRPDLSRFQSSLAVTTTSENPIEDHRDVILDYVASLNGESVVVHCEAGKVRSKWVANQIASKLGYVLVYSTPLKTDSPYHTHRSPFERIADNGN